MKIKLEGIHCNFTFDMNGLDIDVAAEEIRDLRTRVIRNTAEEIKAVATKAATEAVDEAIDKIAEAAPKKAPAKKASAPKKAPAPKKVDPWITGRSLN